ncbi:MAG: hypothetical protein JRC86_05840 [Deltaproteobacteria bacterium]|nr:hypothetical protein [Deltaproteobacteria bacterium]
MTEAQIFALIQCMTLIVGILLGYYMGRKTKDPVPTHQEKIERGAIEKSNKAPESSEEFNGPDLFSEQLPSYEFDDKTKRRKTL